MDKSELSNRELRGVKKESFLLVNLQTQPVNIAVTLLTDNVCTPSTAIFKTLSCLMVTALRACLFIRLLGRSVDIANSVLSPTNNCSAISYINSCDITTATVSVAYLTAVFSKHASNCWLPQHVTSTPPLLPVFKVHLFRRYFLLLHFPSVTTEKWHVSLSDTLIVLVYLLPLRPLSHIPRCIARSSQMTGRDRLATAVCREKTLLITLPTAHCLDRLLVTSQHLQTCAKSRRIVTECRNSFVGDHPASHPGMCERGLSVQRDNRGSGTITKGLTGS